jgi:hypothetical protein
MRQFKCKCSSMIESLLNHACVFNDVDFLCFHCWLSCMLLKIMAQFLLVLLYFCQFTLLHLNDGAISCRFTYFCRFLTAELICILFYACKSVSAENNIFFVFIQSFILTPNIFVRQRYFLSRDDRLGMPFTRSHMS